jgi:hypothetical protein
MPVQKIPFNSGIEVNGDSNVVGNLDVAGNLFDRDSSGNVRNLSSVINLLMNTLPGGYDPLNSLSRDSSTDSGKIADGTADGYVYGSIAVGQTSSLITFDDIQASSGGSSTFSHANTGTLKLILNGVEKASVDLTNFSPDGSPGTTSPTNSYPASGLNISKLVKHDNFSSADWFDIPPEYTRGEVKITIPTSWMRKGVNTLRLEHYVDNTLFGYGETTWFYDAYTQPVTITSPQLTVNTFSNTRYLSGVPFGGNNTTLNVTATVSNFFGGSYEDGTSVTINNGTVGISSNLKYTDCSGYSTPNPKVGEGMSVNRSVTVSKLSKYLTENVYVDLDVICNNPDRDPGSLRIYGTTPIRLMFGNSSANRKTEDFYSELYRIPATSADSLKNTVMHSVPTGLFNSNSSLASGELQVYAGKLIYPKTDYSSTQPGGPNYSSASGTRVYVRAFDGFSPAEAGGKLTINGISRSDIDNDRVKVEICIPGVTGWGDLKYEYLNPVDSDGQGCWYRAAGDGSNGTYGFFLGYNFSNGGNAKAIIVRVTIAESAKSSIEITGMSVDTLS